MERMYKKAESGGHLQGRCEADKRLIFSFRDGREDSIPVLANNTNNPQAEQTANKSPDAGLAGFIYICVLSQNYGFCDRRRSQAWHPPVYGYLPLYYRSKRKKSQCVTSTKNELMKDFLGLWGIRAAFYCSTTGKEGCGGAKS